MHAHERLLHLADVYEAYVDAMNKEGYADFDDLILDVLTTVRARKGILATLQEQYQYVMVDEFQDTNDAQMALVSLIIDAAANENKPNIMVVGDDDQAIYKFQGAELSNILTFQNRYRDVVTVTLTKNYRSVPEIVGLARALIQQGEERLETLTENLEKSLEAAHPDMTSGEVVSLAFDDAVHEQVYVTKEIKRLIDLGSSPESIAVRARNHKQLEALSPILAAHNIPVTYERETNVLDKPHIAQLVTCLRFIGSLADNLTNPDQSLLPMIVQYPFWGAERQEVWRLALAARKTDGGWLSAMLESDQQIFQQIAQLFLALAGKAQREPVDALKQMAEALEEVGLGFLVRLEQPGGEHGRQRQRDHAEDAGRKRNHPHIECVEQRQQDLQPPEVLASRRHDLRPRRHRRQLHRHAREEPSCPPER